MNTDLCTPHFLAGENVIKHLAVGISSIIMFIQTLPRLVPRLALKHSFKLLQATSARLSKMSSENGKNGAEVSVELRSDTFTKPNKAMMEAMMSAEVGDSSYDEDPTTKGRALAGRTLEKRREQAFHKLYF